MKKETYEVTVSVKHRDNRTEERCHTQILLQKEDQKWKGELVALEKKMTDSLWEERFENSILKKAARALAKGNRET